ncbi:MAG: ExeM/NucH family extracellular endonuclease, partial [Candidatus Nanopelagicales bacterium]|nr:ExeM/NucH family extracellular endonuclease [Candidatus Nanopelagicales bacterium]
MLDDNSLGQYPTALRHPNGQLFSLDNLFRGGDTVTNTVGILGFDFSAFRVYPTSAAQYTAVNARPSAPSGGTLRVASVNATNYFLTGGPASNCGPDKDGGCRGWDEAGEFNRQRDKLLAALKGLNADIIGLTEIENTPGVEPLADLVGGLPGYGFVDTGLIGADMIRAGLLYRTAAVTPVGSFKTLDVVDSPRPSLAQTFRDAAGERFTVVVNHFRSKGAPCAGDPDTGDGQGECNGTRKAAAEAVVDWLAGDPTSSGDPDVLLIGDFNSYTLEDPIDALVAGADDTAGTGDDFTNLIKDPFSYTYHFDAQLGSLDHALATGPLAKQVVVAQPWHVNADEPDVLGYDTTFKPADQDELYAADAYRFGDH